MPFLKYCLANKTLTKDILDKIYGSELRQQTVLNLTSKGYKFTGIEDNTFQGMSNVITFEMSFHNLKSITAFTFMGLTNLRKLVLYYNQLQVIPDGAFDMLTLLTEINLGENFITSISSSLFAKVRTKFELFD